MADGRRTTVAVVRYDAADGMKTQECNGGTQPAGWRARNGTLWFPTQQGVVAIDPTRLRATAVSPPPIVEEVIVDGASLVDTLTAPVTGVSAAETRALAAGSVASIPSVSSNASVRRRSGTSGAGEGDDHADREARQPSGGVSLHGAVPHRAGARALPLSARWLRFGVGRRRGQAHRLLHGPAARRAHVPRRRGDRRRAVERARGRAGPPRGAALLSDVVVRDRRSAWRSAARSGGRIVIG